MRTVLVVIWICSTKLLLLVLIFHSVLLVSNDAGLCFSPECVEQYVIPIVAMSDFVRPLKIVCIVLGPKSRLFCVCVCVWCCWSPSPFLLFLPEPALDRMEEEWKKANQAVVAGGKDTAAALENPFQNRDKWVQELRELFSPQIPGKKDEAEGLSTTMWVIIIGGSGVALLLLVCLCCCCCAKSGR